MIEQTRNIYDRSGNVVSATSYQRLDGDTSKTAKGVIRASLPNKR
jgi:hypothetical protein